MLVMAGLALRALLAWLSAPTGFAGDELEYVMRARRMARTGTWTDVGIRSPLAIWYYRAWLGVFGIDSDLRLANAAVGALAALPAWSIGDRLGGRRSAIVAAAAVALYPNFVTFGAFLWTEPLYVLLLLGLVHFLLAWREGSGWQAIPAAVCAAGCLLSREVGVFAVGAAGAWILWEHRHRPGRALAAGALFATTTLLVVAPWAIHQSRTHGTLVLSSTTSWVNFYIGNIHMEGALQPGSNPYRLYNELGASEAERAAATRRLTMERIREAPVSFLARKLASTGTTLFGPTTFSVRRLMGDPDSAAQRLLAPYRFRFPALQRHDVRTAAALVIVGAYIVACLVGVFGLALAVPGPALRLMAALIAAHWFPVFLTFAFTRFRYPIMAILLVAIGPLLARPAPIGETSATRRALAVAATLVMAGLIAGGFALPLFLSPVFA